MKGKGSLNPLLKFNNVIMSQEEGIVFLLIRPIHA